MGMTEVTRFVARTVAVPQVTITPTFVVANSAAISLKRSARPSA
jgi:hypothetical protein